jgi:PAS domain S-box-containing protein
MLKYARSRLKRNEAISHAIFDASIDAMIISDKDGVIESVNQSACDMFGYEENELIGKRIDSLISSPMSLGGASYIVETLKQTGRAPHGLSREIHGLKRDETVFPIELSAAKVTQTDQTFYAGIIRDLSERRRLERRIINIGNKERVQMGRELHDGLGQMLTGIRMQAEVLYRKLKANGLPGADEVGEISNMVRDADEFARNLSRSAVQTNLDGMELCSTLDELCKRVSRMSDIDCRFESSLSSEIEQDDVAQNLYRIAQESITNAIKHGKPKKINVKLSSSQSHTILVIDDDGKGFCEDSKTKQNKGAGLKIMKHRARVLGGVLDITRTDDDTTRVRCIIPQNSE